MTIALTSAREIPAGLLSKITRSKKIGKKVPTTQKNYIECKTAFSFKLDEYIFN
jgi:hypothetical protein